MDEQYFDVFKTWFIGSPTGFLGDWLVGVLSSIMGTIVLSMAYLFCRGTYLAHKRLFN